MSDETFMTTDEICKFLRCSSTTLWRMRQTQPFPKPRHFGRRLLWLRKDIERFCSLVD